MVLVVPAPSTGIASTWEYGGTNWVLRSPAAPPVLGTSQFLMVHDLSRGVSVLTAQNATQTWEYDGFTWTQRAAAPGPRDRACIGFDPHRARTVLHGGTSTAGLPLGDTWEYDGTAWGLVCSGPAVAGASATFDAARRRLVMIHVNAGANLTYEFDGTAWQFVPVLGGLPALTGMALAYDFGRERTLAFGGSGGTFVSLGTHRYGALTPATETAFGQGCAGASIEPGFASQPYQVPYLGMTFGARLYAAPFGQPSVVAFGASSSAAGATPLPVSLQFVGMPGCTLFTSAEILLPTIVSGANASISFAVPPDLQLVGAQFFLQGFACEPGGNAASVIATRALACTIGSL